MTVQRVETTIDNFGGETQTWTDRYLDVWCQPMAIGSSAAGGGEYNDDAQMQADAKYEFVCRYLPGVEYTDRIYWSGGYFDIYQIFPIGRREGMRIRGSWSDDQGDAWSMGGLNAEQVVSGTGGLTLSQVTAEYEANDTGQTFNELVAFYNETSDSFVGPLDTLGIDDTPLAVSVRRLRGDYTGPCMRIRRNSDQAHLDIGFDSNGDLDTVAIETFCAGTLGTVQTWYDQSGSRNHLSQGDTSYQPAIYDNGAVITRNGKPAVIDRLLNSDTSSTLVNTTFGTGRRITSSGVFSLTSDTEDYVGFTLLAYTTSNDTYSNTGWTHATKNGNTTSSMLYDGAVFTNGAESHGYGANPTRQELYDAFSTGPTAISIRATNNAADNGCRLGYQNHLRMLDTQEFILVDNPSLTYFDQVDDAFFAALHGNQMAYFDIT